ncbi:MAG TPA: hypothetical protein VM512_16620 [Burkholderiaceae bacterium]|nr:hypothetical protein [Burkholderiaceae bacterium]
MADHSTHVLHTDHAPANILPFRRVAVPTAAPSASAPTSPATHLANRAQLMQRVLQHAMRSLERKRARATSSDMHAYLTAFAEVSALDHVTRHPHADPIDIERATLQAEATAMRYLVCLNPASSALRHAQYRFGSLMARRVALLIRYHRSQCTATEHRFIDGLLRHTLHWAEAYGLVPQPETPSAHAVR